MDVKESCEAVAEGIQRWYKRGDYNSYPGNHLMPKCIVVCSEGSCIKYNEQGIKYKHYQVQMWPIKPHNMYKVNL